MRSRVLAATLLLFVLASTTHRAQQFVLSSADRARLLALDFVVVDAQGQPVRDLRAEDVTVKIDGRTRAIRALEFVAVAAAATDGGAPALTRVPPAYGSNLTADVGRSVVLIVDRDTIRPGGEVSMKAQINTFLRTLGPQDRVALLVAPYGGLKVDLTSDMSRINVALASITGQYSSESASDASCRTGALLVALRGTMDDLRGGEGPVAVVLFTGQMSVPAGVVSLKSQPDIGRCAVRQEYFSLLSTAAAAARAQFFIIQPDLAVDEGMRAGLEHLSGVTGGPLMYLGGNETSALSRVARETSGYYIARVEPEPSETTGTLRGLGISVARPGTTVRHRPQLSVSRPFVRGANTIPTTPLDMMKQAQLFRDLPLRVTAYTSREPGGHRVRVVTMFDSPDPTAAMSSAMVGLFDGQGRLVSSTQLSGAELASSPVVSAMAVGAGTYRVRVAATEASGRSGAADFTVAAELTPAGPLKMSALVLGTERAGKFLPQLQFQDEVSARAHVEIYGGSEGTEVGVAFEIARTANGPALVTVPGVFDATSEPDRFIITAALAIGALPPGDYVVRATVAAKGQPAGRVLSTLRKVAR
jgi:VWFA-related protein